MIVRILVLVAATAAPAFAQREPLLSGPDCDCIDSFGQTVPQGQTTCITLPGRSFRAVCSMSQNSPTWRATGDPCVTG